MVQQIMGLAGVKSNYKCNWCKCNTIKLDPEEFLADESLRNKRPSADDHAPTQSKRRKRISNLDTVMPKWDRKTIFKQ
ncbi:unnamed protein product [Didymodactylos carnosus]|uniref:Uncharacterized protein n=1 Tax=Didymodactylos carnosus TaxID=1234261 RepID=A0A8S2I7G9_9BILA|nr:unnamed protein product [Didymodactylos carnosus]CAF3723117.1 unnamed protein product [Didymodactylos carnosus]